MTLDQILAEWEADCKVDKTELAEESIKLPQLHSKYLKISKVEAPFLRKLRTEYDELYKVKWQYYLGHLSREELSELGWEPINFKILRSDVDIYLNGDKDLNQIKIRIELQEQKLKTLEEIIRSVNNRNWTIRNALEWEKFKVGI